MLANLFLKTKPFTIISIVMLLCIYYFAATFMQNSEGFSIYFLVKRIIFFFSFVLFLWLFNFIVKKNKLTKDNSYSLFLIVLTLGTFSEAIFAKEIVFSNIILLLSYRKIYSLRSGLKTNAKLFDAAFWIGVSTLIYSWSIIYMVLIYIGIFIYQKTSFKNLLIPIVGLATPIFIYFTYYFYTDNLLVFYTKFTFDANLNFAPYNSLKFVIPITFLLPILLWSIVTITPKILSVSNKFKFSWNVLLNHFLISVVIIILSPIKNGAVFFYLIFPSVIIITNFLQKTKSSILKNLILYLFLIISVTVYFL